MRRGFAKKQEDALSVRDARHTTRSRMRALAVTDWSRKRFSRVRTDEGRVGTPRATPRFGVERVARVRAVVRVARRVGVSPRARGRAPPGGSLVQNEDAPPRGTNEARRLIRGRGARKRSARAYPVDGCVPGHGVLVVSVDERHGADSGGVRRARGSAARRTAKVNSSSAQPTETIQRIFVGRAFSPAFIERHHIL